MIRALCRRLGILLCLLVGCSRAIDWTELKADVRNRFPKARQLTTTELAQKLIANAPSTVPPGRQLFTETWVLIDVRAQDEYEVSRLPGALHLPLDQQFEQSAQKRLGTLPKDTRIVCYCSVGYRSSDAAQRLQELGYSQVFNLEGSIFEWGNQGYPLETAGAETERKIHPYDQTWGQLLDAELRSQ